MLTAPKLWLEATPTAEGYARWIRGERTVPVLAAALHHAVLLAQRAEADLADLQTRVRDGTAPTPSAVERLSRALPLLPWVTMPEGIPRPALPLPVVASTRTWGTLTVAADLVDMNPAKAVAGAVAAVVRFLAGRIP